MRIRFTVTFSATRSPKPQPPEPMVDSAGAQVEVQEQPRYFGFVREDDRYFQDDDE